MIRPVNRSKTANNIIIMPTWAAMLPRRHSTVTLYIFLQAFRLLYSLREYSLHIVIFCRNLAKSVEFLNLNFFSTVIAGIII